MRAILRGGLIAGILDIVAAFVQNGLRGISPVRILQSIASGVLGADSYRGGMGTAALGLVLHFVIATGAAAVYYIASRRLRIVRERPVICGALFGMAVYAFMNLIVLPLSAFPHNLSYPLVGVITGLLIHIFCVGLPIALVIKL